MSTRYVSLSDLFPNVSRATLWRWRKAGKLPKPDRVINNREYYLESRFAPRDDDGGEPHQDQAQSNTK